MPDEKKPDKFAALKAEVEGEPYRVEIGDRGKYVIPHINTLNVFDFNDAVDNAVGDLGAVIAVLQLAMSPEDFKRLREADLNRPTLIALYTAWQEHCGLAEGESSASSA